MKQKTILLLLALAVIALPFLSCDDDYVSATVSQDIRAFIEDKYPDARIIKIEREYIELTAHL